MTEEEKNKKINMYIERTIHVHLENKLEISKKNIEKKDDIEGKNILKNIFRKKESMDKTNIKAYENLYVCYMDMMHITKNEFTINPKIREEIINLSAYLSEKDYEEFCLKILSISNKNHKSKENEINKVNSNAKKIIRKNINDINAVKIIDYYKMIVMPEHINLTTSFEYLKNKKISELENEFKISDLLKKRKTIKNLMYNEKNFIQNLELIISLDLLSKDLKNNAYIIKNINKIKDSFALRANEYNAENITNKLIEQFSNENTEFDYEELIVYLENCQKKHISNQKKISKYIRYIDFSDAKKTIKKYKKQSNEERKIINSNEKFIKLQKEFERVQYENPYAEDKLGKIEEKINEVSKKILEKNNESEFVKGKEK